jgi:hypothetical protein
MCLQKVLRADFYFTKFSQTYTSWYSHITVYNILKRVKKNLIIETGTPGPVLLVNRNNAVVINAIPDDDDDDDDDVKELTPAELHAIEVSACGGVKTTTLAEFLFNHPNDKKGQQKMHQHWFEKKTGKRGVFPDTRNTCYGSHCLAACDLIANLDLYNEFMEAIQIQKEKQKLNHLEGNLAQALKDIPTITELAVLAMYHLAVTCPYLAEIHPEDEELNMLELGPLHQECQRLIQIWLRSQLSLLEMLPKMRVWAKR